MKRPDEAAKAVVPDDEIALLERILRGQLDDHKRMLDCMERNREAVRHADMEAIKLVCQEQNSLAQHLAEVQPCRRVRLVRQLADGQTEEALGPGTWKPLYIAKPLYGSIKIGQNVCMRVPTIP